MQRGSCDAAMSGFVETEVAALRRDVCFAPVSGHHQAAHPRMVPEGDIDTER